MVIPLPNLDFLFLPDNSISCAFLELLTFHLSFQISCPEIVHSITTSTSYYDYCHNLCWIRVVTLFSLLILTFFLFPSINSSHKMISSVFKNKKFGLIGHLLASIFFFLSFCLFSGRSHGIWRFPG